MSWSPIEVQQMAGNLKRLKKPPNYFNLAALKKNLKWRIYLLYYAMPTEFFNTEAADDETRQFVEKNSRQATAGISGVLLSRNLSGHRFREGL
jgi:hypothetical protein